MTLLPSVRRPGADLPWSAVGVHLVAGAFVALLVYAATLGNLAIYATVVVAAFVAVVAILGPERTGVLTLMAAYFTAAFYKGFAPSPGSIVTGTDVLLLVGFALLLPQILQGKARLPLLYYAGVAVVFVTGLVASALSVNPAGSYQALAFWMIVMFGLPIAVSLWGPSGRQIDLLVWSFVAGQIFSFAAGTAQGYIHANRYFGMASHPNYFAQSGMMAIALLIYLAYRHFGKTVLVSAAILVAGGVCATTVVLSGSRAATVVVAVLILMIPVVERSALTGFLLAALGALVLVALPLAADIAGKGSSLDRLAGGGGAAQSSSARTLHLDDGLDRFFQDPLLGSGLIDLFLIHNNFLEVAVAIGIFGLAGYLMVLWAFARPIFGNNKYRRLAYVVWGYIGFGATVPGLYDRSIWAVVALSVVAMAGTTRPRSDEPDSSPAQRPIPIRPGKHVPTSTGARA